MPDFGDCGAVRIASLDDEQELLEMYRDFAQENGIRDSSGRPLPFSERRARMTVRHAISPLTDLQVDGPGGVVGVIGPPGKLEASIALGVQFPPYSEHPYLTEVWNYVAGPYRRGPHLRALAAFAKHIAAQIAAMPFVPGVISFTRTSAKLRVYEREYGAPIGAFFLFNREAIIGEAA